MRHPAPTTILHALGLASVTALVGCGAATPPATHAAPAAEAQAAPAPLHPLDLPKPTAAQAEPSDAKGTPDAPPEDVIAALKALEMQGNDAVAGDLVPRGNLWGDEMGEAFGVGGLGLSGTGQGGSIGLGTIGTIGHGAGSGQGFGSGHGLGGGRQPPKVRMGATNVSGSLPPEVIQRIVRQSFGRFRVCYEQGLAKDPDLAGKVEVRFVIGQDGSVVSADGSGSMPDPAVTACVTNAFRALSFPQPKGGIVNVMYPIVFTPGDDEALGSNSVDDATVDDLRTALSKAGVSLKASTSSGGGLLILEVERAGERFTIVFIPASGDPSRLADDERARLESEAAVHQRGSFWLSVEHADRAKAQTLLDELVIDRSP